MVALKSAAAKRKAPQRTSREFAINMEWKSQLTGNYRTVAIQARDIESMAYKTQDDADAGPIDLCGDDAGRT
ncbi:hypothetical protein JL720_50 [Aureococcus anophagefferens]|nr:hypothetical protein JL720_50 [Aureococcus anophagefferens]